MAWKDPARRREYSAQNSAKIVAAVAEWRLKNPEKRKTHNRRYHIKRTYGITVEEYEAMLEAQGGCCALCRIDTPGHNHASFCVDHCHDSKTVRQLLCHSCNTGLGKFKDDPALLRAAAEYLEKHRPAPL